MPVGGISLGRRRIADAGFCRRRGRSLPAGAFGRGARSVVWPAGVRGGMAAIPGREANAGRRAPFWDAKGQRKVIPAGRMRVSLPDDGTPASRTVADKGMHVEAERARAARHTATLASTAQRSKNNALAGPRRRGVVPPPPWIPRGQARRRADRLGSRRRPGQRPDGAPTVWRARAGGRSPVSKV